MAQIGTVKWFNETKGFGFIESEGNDYFVHHSSIDMDGYRKLSDGQKVSFEPGSGVKGPVAEKVSPIGNA